MRKSFWIAVYYILVLTGVAVAGYLFYMESRWYYFIIALAPILTGITGVALANTKKEKTELTNVHKGIDVSGNQNKVEVEKAAGRDFNETHIHYHSDTSTPPTPPEKKKITDRPVRNLYFTGREDKLEEIRKTFENEKTVSLMQTITGLGGIGKTQLALRYADIHRDEYKHIFELTAQTKETILAAFQTFANKMNIICENAKDDEIVEKVLDWMQDNDNWLFIYDNVEDEETLQPYLPQNRTGRRHILITTRNTNFIYAAKTYIDVLPEAEACELLWRYAQKPIDDDCRALANELGCMPLALVHAGEYLNVNKNTTYREYLDNYEIEKIAAFMNKPLSYKETVATTWKISFEKIEKNKAAKQLLYLCAFLAPENIKTDFFADAIAVLPDELRKEAANKLKYNPVISELAKYSLISQKEAGILSIHRLVQEVIRDNLKHEQTQWQNHCVNIFNELRNPDFSKPELRERFRILATHIQALTEKDDIEETEQLANLYHFLGYGYDELADYDRALEYYEKALPIREKVLGKEHPDTATTYKICCYLRKT